jgi:AraC-like DNA-binding protein
MSPVYRKITYSQLFSFSTVFENPPLFKTAWHHHPEYELIFILGSVGTRFMGDSIKNFNETELVLIGPHLPHCWKEDPSNVNPNAVAYVVHFSESFLGKEFFRIPEGRLVRQLLDRSQLGLRFFGDIEKECIAKMQRTFETDDFDRVLSLLDLLNFLAKSESYEQLSSAGFTEQVVDNQSDRINRVLEYTLENFNKPIDLKTVSDLAFMSRSAFCRFFKKSTGKTYFDFVKEIRVGHACKLLQETDESIHSVAYNCGYENISNFNRQFKESLNISPLKYRQTIAQKALME